MSSQSVEMIDELQVILMVEYVTRETFLLFEFYQNKDMKYLLCLLLLGILIILKKAFLNCLQSWVTLRQS